MTALRSAERKDGCLLRQNQRAGVTIDAMSSEALKSGQGGREGTIGIASLATGTDAIIGAAAEAEAGVHLAC